MTTKALPKEKQRPKKAIKPTPKELVTLREMLFPELSPFTWPEKRYSQFPWILRNCLSRDILTPEEWLIYSLLMLRIGQERLYPIENQEIREHIGGVSQPRIANRLKKLQELGFICRRLYQGRQFVCLRNPEEVVRELRRRGYFQGDKLQRLERDIKKLKRAGYREPKVVEATSSLLVEECGDRA